MTGMHAAFNRGIDAALATLGFEKTAVSAGMIERLLAARQAQGVRISPNVMRKVKADLAEWSPDSRLRLRQLAFMTGKSARSAAAAERAAQNPVTQDLRRRANAAWEASMTNAPGAKEINPAVSGGLGYTQEHINSLMGSGELVDPTNLMAAYNKMPRRIPVAQQGVSAVERTGIAPYNPMAFEQTAISPNMVLPSRTAAPGDLTTPGIPRRISDLPE